MAYRVAILGCRNRGQAAARAYAAHPGTEVVALCDLVKERRDELGDELSVDARFDDLDDMMTAVGPDIVAIPVGTEFHFELGMRVLEYGAHIDIEKPICVDLEQGDALLEKARSKGSSIAVHHQGRTGASMRAVCQAVEAGKLGELQHVSASGKGYYGGYGLMNIGTHSVNAMLELTGRCHQVHAVAVTGEKPVDPTDVVASPNGMGTICGEFITATFVFGANVSATLTQHRFPQVDARAHHAQFHGTEGRIYWTNPGAYWCPDPYAFPGPQEEWIPLEATLPSFGDIGEAAIDEVLYVDEFVNALDEGRSHTSSGEEGVHVLEILMGVFESAAYGTKVDLPQVQRDHPLIRWREEASMGAVPAVPRPYNEWLAEEDNRLGRSG